MRTAVEWMERWQVPLYLAAFVLGAGIGLLIPAIAHPAELAINPVLGLLLYATFLGVPFAKIGQAFRDWRFLVTVLTVNFVAVPIVVYVLSRIVAHDQVLLIGVLFVLLTPCVDYVIVFTGIAGGAKDRLLAAAPLLMLAQMLLLPLYLWLFVGAEFVATVDFAPFIEAFLLLIALPLVAAGFTQLAAAGTRWGVAIQGTVLGAMVPLMMLSLAVVVASQIAGVGRPPPGRLPGSTSPVAARSCSAARPATPSSSSRSSSPYPPRSTLLRSSLSHRPSSSSSSWSCSCGSSRDCSPTTSTPPTHDLRYSEMAPRPVGSRLNCLQDS